MSLILNHATPSGTRVISTIGGIVAIGPVEMPIEEFCVTAMYVLANTDLEPDDPRLEFVKDVKRLAKIRGFNFQHNPKAQRLGERRQRKNPAGRTLP
jgi:hypothetical protein